MIDFSEAEDFVSYTQSLAGIISSIIYFESSTAASFKADPESPYFLDKYGKMHRKDETQQFLDTYNTTYYRDMFLAVDSTIREKPEAPLVRQDEEVIEDEEAPKYNVTGFTFVQFYFGFLNGALNALPVGGNLYFCGKDLESQRLKLVSMYEFYEERQLTNAVTDGYNAMIYINPISVSCYYGALEYFNLEELGALFQEFDILKNIIFNIGFMWTDILMLIVGRPGETETDYGFYLAFYLGDFIFRFIFR